MQGGTDSRAPSRLRADRSRRPQPSRSRMRTLMFSRPAAADDRGPSRSARRRKSRGQSLVELGLILPVLLLFLAGALDLGRIFYAHITVRNAAREGALQASKTPSSYLPNGACNTTTNLVTCRVILEAKGGTVVLGPTDISLSCSVAG